MRENPFHWISWGTSSNAANKALENKLEAMAKYREERAAKILDNLNREFKRENIQALTEDDFRQIEESVDGVLGRPHIADYLVKKNIVKNAAGSLRQVPCQVRCAKVPTLLGRSIKTCQECRWNAGFSSPQ